MLILSKTRANQGILEGLVYICEGAGVRFADFISFYLNRPIKMK